MRRFWNWVRNEADAPTTRTLYLEGVIAEESWWDDDITPKMFREELFAGDGDIEVYVNSPGGCCVAASQIYTMLMEYPHNVTIKIHGIAASAASVISMAGTKVLIAPTAYMMVHQPLTWAAGNADDLRKEAKTLDEVSEGIINAYEIKTGLPRAKLKALMDDETWLSAHKAVELGFADEVLSASGEPTAKAQTTLTTQAHMFRRGVAVAALMNKLRPAQPPPATGHQATGTPIADLEKRLALLR